MHLFIEFIYKIGSICIKSWAERYMLQSWLFKKDCTSLLEGATKITDQNLALSVLSSTPTSTITGYGCEEEWVQEERGKRKFWMLHCRYAEERAESHGFLPEFVQLLELACGGAAELLQCTSPALLRPVLSAAPCEAVPCCTNTTHTQKGRDLVFWKNKCNQFKFGSAIFHMNTHIVFLLFSQFCICSGTSLLSFGDVARKFPWNHEVLTGQLTQIKAGSAPSHAVPGGNCLGHGTRWFQPAR